MDPTPPPMQKPMSLARSASDLLSDLRCMRCGYPLRGLATSTACPECGLEIAATFAGPALGNINPFFLHRIVYGVTGVAAGTSLWGLVCVVRVVIKLAETPPRIYDYWLNHVSLIAWTTQWFSALYFLAGREGSNSTHESALSLRKLLLYSAILLFLVHIVPIGLLVQTPLSYLWYETLYSLFDKGTLIILHLFILTLARRTDDVILKRHYSYALAAMVTALVFEFIVWHVWRGFRSSTLTTLDLLKVAAIGYLSFLLFRLRAGLLPMLPTWAKDAEILA